MADKYFNMLLLLLRKVIPNGKDSIPENYDNAKKIVYVIGLDYNKIDACPNDCILYYKDNKDLQECPICGVSRWVQRKNYSTHGTIRSMLKQNKIPAKVLHHFPLIPRLKRLYMNKDTAKQMRWHMEERTDDGKIRHPADAEAWKHMDRTFPWFANECRNVRLGLSSDGFNPFGIMSSGWSTWPVVLTPYNLPPWLCMKQPYMILSLLIPGKHAPGNDIDVFLEPLINELKQLWTGGVITYDTHAKQSFRLCAILLWTINDFPAYTNLSGWSTKGTYACPVCGPEFKGLYLQHSRKFCYWFNRRWLNIKHRYRTKKWSKFFDDTVEKRDAPRPLREDQIVHFLEMFPAVSFGKKRYSKDDLLGVRNLRINKRMPKRKRQAQVVSDGAKVVKLPSGWTKFSIFFQLPYWKELKIRHNLDVMHIEKNICDNLLSTLLQDANKSKDDLRARRDLTALNIREELQPKNVGNDRLELPASRITMSKVKMQTFCQFLKSIKLPEGYSANISNYVQVQEMKILGLKTHDYHVLLRQLLPVALRSTMQNKKIVKVIIDFCGFFRKLCSKVIDARDFEKLGENISETMCEMEMLFPPSFFTIMVHLTHHLAEEAAIAGPVHYRWMYPIERYLGSMKRQLRNRARPEGSIAESYVRSEQHQEKLKNEVIGSTAVHDIKERHMKEFSAWLNSEIQEQLVLNNQISEEVKVHAKRPYYAVIQYGGYRVNGYKFYTMEVDDTKVTQNSGVMATFSKECFSNRRDQNPVENNMTYYGRLEDVVEIFYGYGGPNEHKYMMFMIRWCFTKTQKDPFGFTIVNLDKEIDSDEKFMFASQVEQCFYVKDPTVKDEWVVLYKDSRAYIQPSTNEDYDESYINNFNEPNTAIDEFSYPQNIVFETDASTTRTDIPNIITDIKRMLQQIGCLKILTGGYSKLTPIKTNPLMKSLRVQERSGEGEEEPTHIPLYADPAVILQAYIPGIERGPLPACAEGYRLKQNEKYMLAKKRLDEWAPQIDEILSDIKNKIRQRFGEKLYQKKGHQGSDFKKKLPSMVFEQL
ncbi:uncharacterized protein LOC109847122 [Asparagus officinalis]|uniref:uncharacterized protein LOC109847122 n=1 Tax=Asparagus officinalis TaxID=4686 RepID=UPI00098E3241|nr:uncharacterized protein LOC109847122 [Asparagus officinalis]